jgi:hypothetical protein
MKRPSKNELIKYSVFYEKDTDFTAHARLFQSQWRIKKVGAEKQLFLVQGLRWTGETTFDDLC